jgi:predicted nuclease of predicted toxin-antitoxin system
MAYRILADAHVEPAARNYLEKLGHDVEFVAYVDELGEAATDHEVARYACQHDRVVLTHDVDYFLDIDPADAGGVLFLEEDDLSARKVGTIVDEIATYVPQDEVVLEYVSTNWL